MPSDAELGAVAKQPHALQLVDADTEALGGFSRRAAALDGFLGRNSQCTRSLISREWTKEVTMSKGAASGVCVRFWEMHRDWAKKGFQISLSVAICLSCPICNNTVFHKKYFLRF
jgi:hypothetical protein